MVDAGIVGHNLLIERRLSGSRTRARAARLRAVPPGDRRAEGGAHHEARDLHGRRVATTFPHIVGDYFERLTVLVELVEIAGAVELTPALGWPKRSPT